MHCVEKWEIFSHQKIFRQINCLLTYLAKPLLSRNFCQKCVRDNSPNFHIYVYVTNLSWKWFHEKLLFSKFREIDDIPSTYLYINFTKVSPFETHFITDVWRTWTFVTNFSSYNLQNTKVVHTAVNHMIWLNYITVLVKYRNSREIFQNIHRKLDTTFWFNFCVNCSKHITIRIVGL